MNKIAICQPYFAPYLGYFQLINEVDIFISYNDVNFIKKGWINRNKILSNKEEKYFTIPLKKQSQYKKINETMIDWDNREIYKFVKNLEHSYSKRPFFNETMEIVYSILGEKHKFISDLSLSSLIKFCNYLDINTIFKNSSDLEYEKTNDRSQNLINICINQGCNHYINPIGGLDLYNKKFFSNRGIKLNFLKGKSSLSIIDVCMNNSAEEIREYLGDFRLI